MGPIIRRWQRIGVIWRNYESASGAADPGRSRLSRRLLSPLFVTFRLHDSLPANRVFPPERLTTGKAFVAMDRILDRARGGPLFLQQPEIAGLTVDALRDGERRFHRYELHSFVVMSNHEAAAARI